MKSVILQPLRVLNFVWSFCNKDSDLSQTKSELFFKELTQSAAKISVFFLLKYCHYVWMLNLYLIPISVGFFIVIQGVLIKQFSGDFGLSTATFINAMIFALLAFVLFILTQKYPLLFPDFFPPKLSLYQFQLWHLIPGIAGFAIVTLVPVSLKHLATAHVFVLIIAAQILFSALWDYWANTLAFSPAKVMGLILVTGGAALFTLSK